MKHFSRHPIAAVLLLVCFLSPGCGEKESARSVLDVSTSNPPPEPVAVSLVKAEARPLPRHLRVTGELKADQDSAVAANATGKVMTAAVERGAEVTEGQTLVTLDDCSARFSLAEAEATVASAVAKLALARTELTRNEPLVKSHATSQAEFQRLKTDRDAAMATLAAAEARRNLADSALKDLIIRAPFSGAIAERLVDPGECVKPDTEVARLIAMDWLRLHLTIPETSVGQVHEGQMIAFTVAAWPGEAFAGEVMHIGAAVREDTRDLLIEARVDNADRKLKPGMFAEGRLKLGEVEAVAVPDTAVRVMGNRRSVFLVDEGIATEVLVELGESSSGWVEIVEAIGPAVAVIDSPAESLRDGDPVTVTHGNKD